MTVTQTGATEAAARLEAMAARLRDLSPVTQVIAADTMTLIDDSLANSRAPDGSAWAPLAASTLAARRGTTATPLVDTGRLRGSIFARGSRTGLAFGTNVEYAAPHQLGNASGRPPKRAFLPVEMLGSAWSLMTSGPAGTHWTRARDAVRRYITEGVVT